MNPIELRSRREALGLSQVSLADLLGVKQDKVSLWEYGKRPIPEGIDRHLAEWEETVEELVDAAGETIERIEAAEGCPAEPLVLAVFSSDEALWVAHPEMDGTPAVLHRVAMARTRAMFPELCVLDEWAEGVRVMGVSGDE